MYRVRVQCTAPGRGTSRCAPFAHMETDNQINTIVPQWAGTPGCTISWTRVLCVSVPTGIWGIVRRYAMVKSVYEGFACGVPTFSGRPFGVRSTPSSGSLSSQRFFAHAFFAVCSLSSHFWQQMNGTFFAACHTSTTIHQHAARAHLLNLALLALGQHGQEHEGPPVFLAIRRVRRVAYELRELLVGHHEPVTRPGDAE